MRDNERYIDALYPHFDTVWVEDHFQWESRPVLEAMTTLTYLAGRHEQSGLAILCLGSRTAILHSLPRWPLTCSL